MQTLKNSEQMIYISDNTMSGKRIVHIRFTVTNITIFCRDYGKDQIPYVACEKSDAMLIQGFS